MGKFFEMPDRRRNTQITWRRSGSENIHLNPGQPRPRMKQENVSGESGGSSPPVQDSLQDDGEARNDFWSISGNYIYPHHIEPNQTERAERRIILNSATIHRRDQSNKYDLGCNA